MSDTASTRALLTDQIERVWGAGEVELVDHNYAADCIDHMPVAGQAPGIDAMKQIVRDFRIAMPDLKMELKGVLAAGDIGVDFWTLTGTHTGNLMGVAPTGRRVKFSGIDMARVADGRIVELWHCEEMLHFWQQLGRAEAPFGQPDRPDFAPPSTSRAHDPGHGVSIAIATEPTAIERANVAVARRHIEHMWARSQPHIADEVYVTNVVDHNPAPAQRSGIAGIQDVIGWMTQSVPDLQMSVKQYVVDGDFVADRWEMRGTHTGAPLMGLPARGRSFEINGMDVVRIADGRITDVWHVEEFDRLRAAISA